jgi:hypothetical protein
VEKILRDTNGTHGPKIRKKGTWREAKFPLSIAMVPKAGFEPARVSPPPPQDGAVCAGLIIRRLSGQFSIVPFVQKEVRVNSFSASTSQLLHNPTKKGLRRLP